MSVILGSNASSHSRSLLSHVHRLLNVQSSTPDHLLDTVLYCRDGIVKWNRFMLASNSSLLASCEDVFEAILLPDITVSTVTSMLRCTVNPTVRNDTLSVNELEVMRLLGFTKLSKHNNTNQEKSQPQQKAAQDKSNEAGSKMPKISEATMVSTVPNNNQPSLLGITEVTDDHIPSEDKKRKSTSKKVIECNFVGCGLTFTRQLHLERHKASHTNDQDFICERCGKLFHHQDNLALHMSYHEDIFRLVQCSECHVVCQGKRSLKSHMDSSHVAKVQCNKCGRYLRKRQLKKHILKKHRGGEEDLNSRVFCHLCGKDFSNGQALMTHKRSHNQNNGYLTTKKNNSNNSNKEHNFVRCEECGKLFVSQKHLNLHSKRTHGQMYACGQCGKNVKDLDSHFKRVHDEETLVQQEVQKNISGGPVNCTDCNKMFSSIYTFEYHKQRVHGGADQRQHECTVCGKRFAGTLSRLSRHLREAHAENRFECTVCGHFFPVRASLERHMTTVHRPTRLECPFCAVVVVHLAAHLSASHGLESKEARGLATQLAGKSSARTHLTVDMVVSRPRSSLT